MIFFHFSDDGFSSQLFKIIHFCIQHFIMFRKCSNFLIGSFDQRNCERWMEFLRVGEKCNSISEEIRWEKGDVD